MGDVLVRGTPFTGDQHELASVDDEYLVFGETVGVGLADVQRVAATSGGFNVTTAVDERRGAHRFDDRRDEGVVLFGYAVRTKRFRE